MDSYLQSLQAVSEPYDRVYLDPSVFLYNSESRHASSVINRSFVPDFKWSSNFRHYQEDLCRIIYDERFVATEAALDTLFGLKQHFCLAIVDMKNGESSRELFRSLRPWNRIMQRLWYRAHNFLPCIDNLDIDDERDHVVSTLSSAQWDSEFISVAVATRDRAYLDLMKQAPDVDVFLGVDGKRKYFTLETALSEQQEPEAL